MVPDKSQGPENIEYKTLVYIDGLSECMGKEFVNHGFKQIKFAHQPRNKLFKYLRNMNDKLQKSDEKRLVYAIKCLNCEKVNIGHTRNSLEQRMYGYKYNMK